MNDHITEVSLALNGDMLLTGYVNGKKVYWVLEQSELLLILQLAADRQQDPHAFTYTKGVDK